jgi:hypothetical protein
MKFPSRKAKALVFLLLIATSIVITFSFLPSVKAQTHIISLSSASAKVGSTIYLMANISNANGNFTVFFDGVSLLNGTAVGNDVNASFVLPHAVAGNHTIMVVNVANGENATSAFLILTDYLLKISVPDLPQQLQEGNSTRINATVTGGDASTTYIANITVKAPNNATFTKMLNITTSSEGSGNTTLTYPEEFSTSANTNFTGEYQVQFNTTLATGAFFVGLTNSTQYHRSDALNVRATGYAPEENVTLTIAGKDLSYSENLTASTGGVISYTNGTILSNATIGTYTINITSMSGLTIKEPLDAQTFMIPGFDINVTARNLAGEPVPNVFIGAFQDNRSVANATSDSSGMVYLKLEIGNYACNASFRDLLIGEIAIQVNNAASFDLSCNLTNLKVLVLNQNGIQIPEVQLFLAPENQTMTTDINGTASFHSILPNFNYILNASRYNTLFNTTTIAMLPATAWFDLTIICPTLTLQINVTNVNGQPINNAIVKVQELKGGLLYEGNTVDGLVTLNCTLGRYTAGVYVNGMKLNETIVNLNETTVNLSIKCGLYGLDVSVRVVDYFGQTVPNVNVTLQRSGVQDSRAAGADGRVLFGNIAGGELQVIVRLSGQSEPCVVTTAFIDNSTTIEIKVDKYVMLAGLLVETSQLITVIIIVLIVILILSVEILRRRRFKPQKNEKLESE